MMKACVLFLFSVLVMDRILASCKRVEYCDVRGEPGNCELDFAYYDCSDIRHYVPRTCRDGETRENCVCTCYGDGYSIFTRTGEFRQVSWLCLQSCPAGNFETSSLRTGMMTYEGARDESRREFRLRPVSLRRMCS